MITELYISAIFFTLADPSKSALLTQYFYYLKALIFPKKVALVVKNSIDSENGVKCGLQPTNHIFLDNPPKNL